MPENTQIFTLKQVVSSIRKTIEERYQRVYWIKAEMHKLNQFPSGHCFPELAQKENGKIVAQIGGSIWKHNFERINKRFIKVVKEPLKEDTTLLMQVKVNFHELYGISLQILDIDPNYSLGELHKERTETLQRLKKEELLNANQQLKFPLLPKRIAVISADASKGLSDFMQVLDQNEWGYAFFTMLFPAYLQGDQAAGSIMKQLENIKKVKHRFDLVVIVRGGGGEVGLSCYNNYEMCKAIASFPMPVLTGIGHSTNYTVAEMISYRNGITPTELADFLLQAFHNFSVPLKDAVKTLKIFSEKKLTDENHHISTLSTLFSTNTRNTIRNEKQEILDFGTKLIRSSKELVNRQQERMIRMRSKIVNLGQFSVQDEHNNLRRISDKMPAISTNLLKEESSKVELLSHQIRLLDPINTLKRGYSITTINGKVVSKESDLQKGDEIKTKTASFTIESTVSKLKNDE